MEIGKYFMEGSIASKHHQRSHDDKKRRLHQHGIKRFAVGAHAFKTTGHIKRTYDEEKPTQCKQVGKQNKITCKRQQSRCLFKWDKKNGKQHRRQVNGCGYLKYIARSRTIHTSFFQKSENVQPRLKYSRPFTPAKDGFRLHDNPGKERGSDQD